MFDNGRGVHIVGPAPSTSGGPGVFSSVTDTALTSGRVVIVGTGGLLEDDAGLTYNKTTDILTAAGFTSTVATGTAPFVVASTTVVANLNASALGGATFAAPGAIGGGTPAAITGTTGTFSGRISASGVNNTVNSNTTIWNSTFIGPTIANTSTTVGAVAGIGFFVGTGGNSAAGIGAVQEVASSLAALSFYTGGLGRSSTTPERLRIDSAGLVNIVGNFLGFGSATSPTLGLTNSAGTLQIGTGAAGSTAGSLSLTNVTASGNVAVATQSPAAAAGGTVGTITWDSGFLYVNTAAGVWKRVAITGGY